MLLLLLCTVALCAVPAAAQPKCVCYNEVLSGLRAVTEIEAPPDGSGRLFLCEQAGFVNIMDSSDTLLTPPFMDLSASVVSGGERGFLAMTFHPDYVDNRRFYVYYSTDTPGMITRLSEFFTSATDPNLADMATERVLMEIDQPYANHNGGDLLFGLDRMLYMFIGDGGSSGDPSDNGQNKDTKLGTTLRIDVDSRTGNLEYGIPADNPFLSDPEAANNPELYAYGLRNPWRATMDVGDRSTQAGRGRVFIADVGQNKHEEVDLLQAGGNFGWAGREGPECFKDNIMVNCPTRPVCVTDATEVCPLVSYEHATTGECIIGGHIYRGCVNVDYSGWYFFADYSVPKMYRMIESSPDEWEMDAVPTCASCSVFVGVPYTIGMDGNGEVYLSTASTPDRVYRIYDPDYVTTPPCLLP